MQLQYDTFIIMAINHLTKHMNLQNIYDNN